MIEVRFIRIPESDQTIPTPEYQTKEASGCDLRANLSLEFREVGLNIQKMSSQLVPTGLAIVIPRGYEGQIRPRSGLALKHGITVLNTPGTIDSDYRGEVGVILLNIGPKDYVVNHGERIAQLVLNQIQQIKWVLSEELETTNRNHKGFGTTGKY